MVRHLLAVILAVTFIAYASDASAQTDEDAQRDVVITNAWSDSAHCNRAIARQISFRELASDPDGLIDACVAVEGYWAGRALFSSARDARSRSSQSAERLRGRRVGLYAQWESIVEPPRRPARTIFVGIVGRCAQWADVLMVMGYCHYTGGPILIVAEAYPSGDIGPVSNP